MIARDYAHRMVRARQRRANAARYHWLTLRAALLWRRHRNAITRPLQGVAAGVATLIYFAGIFSLFLLPTY